MTDQVKAAAARVSRSRILFAHQSVGANIIEGLAEIEEEIGERTPVAQFDASRQWEGIASARVGSNGNPKSKTEAFAAAVTQSAPAIAVHKYCYVDLQQGDDAAGLFDFYRERVMALAQANPNTRVVHMTMPLMSVEDGLKAAVRRLLGRSRDHAPANAVREQFNHQMRASFAADTIFDLAALESSTEPRALRADFTTDGGHLNARGRRHVAAAFLEFLARAAA